MKLMKKSVGALLGIVIFAGGMAGCAPQSGTSTNIAGGDLRLDENFKCTITVDGGGQWANYNTTDDMTESETNPYPYRKITPEVKKLRAYKRIFLKKGETKQVTLRLDAQSFEFINAEMKKETAYGKYDVMIADQTVTTELVRK